MSCNNNLIYHNNFINNNKNNALDDSENVWDSGYPDGGNYWDDFDEPSEGAFDNLSGEYQILPGSDGIVDSPYQIPRESLYPHSGPPPPYENLDWYPLLHPNGWINNPPEPPAKPSGRRFGFTHQAYTYTTHTIDPEDHSIYYNFSWGDGTYSDWFGPYVSGEHVSASHLWASAGTYQITVKAKDTRGYESEWSKALSVKIIDVYLERT
jgi:hypothetical protein